MKVHTKKFSTIIILSMLVFVLTSSVCSAQGSRSGRSEIYGILQNLGGATVDEDDEVKLDDAYVYGVGVGYNLDDHFNLNTDLVFGTQDAFDEDDRKSANAFLWNVNLDYNILEGPLTPLVSGGIGFATYRVDYMSGSDFTYNLGAGGRWDISDNFFIKALYKMTWFEDFDQDGIFLGIGYMY